MRSVRILDRVNHFVSQDVHRPALPDGGVRVRVKAAFLPPYFEHLPSGGWLTPPRPFTPGQCAIGIVEETADPTSPLRRGQSVYCDMYIEGPGAEADYGFIGCFGLTPAWRRHSA